MIEKDNLIRFFQDTQNKINNELRSKSNSLLLTTVLTRSVHEQLAKMTPLLVCMELDLF